MRHLGDERPAVRRHGQRRIPAPRGGRGARAGESFQQISKISRGLLAGPRGVLPRSACRFDPEGGHENRKRGEPAESAALATPPRERYTATQPQIWKGNCVSSGHSVTTWISLLREGDHEAAQRLW